MTNLKLIKNLEKNKNGGIKMFTKIFKIDKEEKIKQDYKKTVKKFIKSYTKVIFKRNSVYDLQILEDVCYKIYTSHSNKMVDSVPIKEAKENESKGS